MYFDLYFKSGEEELNTLQSWLQWLSTDPANSQRLPFNHKIQLCLQYQSTGQRIVDKTVFKGVRIGGFFVTQKCRYKRTYVPNYSSHKSLSLLTDEEIRQLVRIPSFDHWLKVNGYTYHLPITQPRIINITLPLHKLTV